MAGSDCPSRCEAPRPLLSVYHGGLHTKRQAVLIKRVWRWCWSFISWRLAPPRLSRQQVWNTMEKDIIVCRGLHRPSLNSRAQPFPHPRATAPTCNPRTAADWLSDGCAFSNPSATQVANLGTHTRVMPTTSCEVTCPSGGGGFVVSSATGIWVGAWYAH